jgi:hypothetical protein
MDKARSTLNVVGLRQELWEEADNTEKYMVNMFPSSVLVEMNPHELWSGQNPSVSLLKVFVCDAFVHVSKEKRRKWTR